MKSVTAKSKIDTERAKREIDLVEYAERATGIPPKKVGVNTWRINPCPVCGAKDHFTITNKTGQWLYNSFNDCTPGGDIFRFVEEIEGVKGFRNVCEHLEKQGYKLPTVEEIDQDKPLPALNAKFDLRQEFETLSKATRQTNNYFSARGIGDELQRKYLLSSHGKGLDYFISKYPQHFKERPNDYTKNYKHFIPILEPDGTINHFLPYLASGHEGQKVRNLKGKTARLFNDRYLRNPQLADGKYLFICEGVFDALSFEEIGYSAISLNSVTNYNQLLQIIQQELGKDKSKYTGKVFVICGDNDTAGEKLNKDLQEGFSRLGLDYFIYKVPDSHKDANEFLLSDRQRFKAELDQIEQKRQAELDKELGIVATCLMEFVDEINKNANSEGIPTGFQQLDKKLGGGLYAGLYTLGAISSLGKTSFALQISDNIAAAGHPVLFFSLEMARNEVIAKSLSRLSVQIGDKRTTREILNKRASGNFYARALELYKPIAGNLAIVEGNFSADVSFIRQKIDKFIQAKGQKPVVVVDYLQILRPESDRLTDKQAVDRNVVNLKIISRDFDIPVLLISSFNRENYLSPVSFSSFKESGAIEYSSDCVIGLQLKAIHEAQEVKKVSGKTAILNEAKARNPRVIELVILKNRNGKAFDTLDLEFYPKYNHFQEVQGGLCERQEGR